MADVILEKFRAILAIIRVSFQMPWLLLTEKFRKCYGYCNLKNFVSVMADFVSVMAVVI